MDCGELVMERLRAKEGGFEEEDGGSERNLVGEKKRDETASEEGTGRKRTGRRREQRREKNPWKEKEFRGWGVRVCKKY